MMSTKVHGTTSGKRAETVAMTVSRTTFASRPLTKVPAPPRGRICDTGHDDPGLQQEDLLRRPTEQQEIHVIPIKTAVAVHPTRIARTTSARWTSFCMHVGLVPSRNKHAKMSPRELGSVDHGAAREICVRR